MDATIPAVTDPPAAAELLALYRAVDWPVHAHPERVAAVLASPCVFVTARTPAPESRLVAFARLLTDRVHYAVVFDVMVHPDHQRRGLGTAVVRALLDEVADVRKVILATDPRNVPFYERLGFAQSPRYMERVRWTG